MISPIATIAAPMPSRPRAWPHAALVLPPPMVALTPAASEVTGSTTTFHGRGRRRAPIATT
jgi:hypothetical protein